MTRLLHLILALSSGCSIGAKSADEQASDAAGAFSDTAEGDATTGGSGGFDSGEPLEDAAWWRLGAAITLDEPTDESGGLVTNAVGGVVTVESLDAGGVVRCEGQADITRFNLLSAPEPEVLVWWQVNLGAWTGTCADAGVQVPLTSLQLGVGALHPELLAVLGTVESAVDGSEESLNGAYARVESGASVYVFGVAGTAEAYAGLGSTALEAPLAAGDWVIEPAYSFAAGDGW